MGGGESKAPNHYYSALYTVYQHGNTLPAVVVIDSVAQFEDSPGLGAVSDVATFHPTLR